MERLGDTVRRELGRFGTAGSMAETVACWPEVVGEQVAVNAWPARYGRDGTLHVSTSSSAWAFELGQLEGEILPRLREALGELAPRRLRFAPGPLPELGPVPSARVRPAVPEPSAEQQRAAHELVAGIESEELRKTVEKAARRSLASSGYGRSV
jgi:hypothetical protein